RAPRRSLMREVAGAGLDERVVVQRPEVVAGAAEVLEADASRRRVGHHPRAPGAVVLDAPDAHRGLVDVDPVVREEVLAVDDERDGQEVAVAKTNRGLAQLLGPGRGA